MIAGQRSLAVQAEEAELLSSLVMANMDEPASSSVHEQADRHGVRRRIAAGLLELMQRYGLEGVVQTRIGGKAKTVSANGRIIRSKFRRHRACARPGRIFEFRQRSVPTFSSASR